MDVRVEVRLPSADEIASLAGVERDELLVALERIDRMVQAAKLDVIDHAERVGRFAADGHRSTAAWTRAVINCSPAESRRRIRAMRALRDLPGFRAALHVARIAGFGVRGSDGYGLVVIADDGTWFPVNESSYCGRRRLTGWAAALSQASGREYTVEAQTFRPDEDDNTRWSWAA